MKALNPVHTGQKINNLLMSDRDSSEIAEKLQAIDAKHGERNLSVTSNERDSASLYSMSNPVRQMSRDQQARPVGGSRSSHTGSNPFIKAGAMSFDK